jgi:DUF2934 family protein
MKTTGRKTVKGDKVSAPKAVKASSSKTAEAKPAEAKLAAEPAAMTAASVASKPMSKSAPTHEEIAKRSYELYLARGSLDGHAEDDWARAVAELQGR